MATLQRKTIHPEATLSFSAGSRSLDPWAFREISKEKSDKLLRFVQLYPGLASSFSGSAPVVISCYPAAIGAFAGTIFVDTYLKPETFVRALLLAKELDAAAIILGQPLSAADLLLQHIKHGYDLPSTVVLCLGGYPCPLSLEQFLSSVIASRMSRAIIVHAYGVGEVDAACLIGVSRSKNNDVLYCPISESVVPVLVGNNLHLDVAGRVGTVDTGDQAQQVDRHYIIRKFPRACPSRSSDQDGPMG